MKAVFIEQHGGTEVLQVGDRPEPLAEPGEVKIRLKACALNRLDIYARMGARGLKREFPPPLILGGDAAGDVVEVGPGVTALKPGDRVVVDPWISCRQCPYCRAGQDNLCPRGQMLGTHRDGSYAEFVVAPAVNAFPIPQHLSYQEAAALPTVYLPVWNILLRHAQLKPWESCLVLSASSGVGTAAIQVVKKVIGATCIATTSTPEKARQVSELGADHVILYTQEDIAQRVKEFTGGQGVDAVVDHVGTRFYDAAFASLRRGGRYGICGVTTGYKAELHMGRMFSMGLHVFGVYMGTREDMRQIVEMASQGVIRGVVGLTFPLHEAAKAQEAMEQTNFFGKIVLEIP